MSYFGVSTRNGVGLGLGTVPSLTNTPLGYRLAPSLDLSFAGSDALSPAITFSRTTNATLTNSAGLIANAPMNLLTFSEQFDNAAWGKNAATVTANAIVAPNGTTTADLLIPNGTSAAHYAVNTIAVGSAGSNGFSIYIKAGGYSKFGVRDQGGGTVEVSFSLSGAGSVIELSGATATAAITAINDDWYRVVVTSTLASATAYRLFVLPDAYTGGNLNTYFWTGDGTSGIYIWGAQLELGSTATTYNPTTVKNLLGFTENFDNAAWTKSNAFVQTNLLLQSEAFDTASWIKDAGVSVSANTTAAPDGTNTADTVTWASAANIYQGTIVGTGALTFSTYARVASGTASFLLQVFNATDGTLSSTTLTATTSWQRFSFNFTVTANSFWIIRSTVAQSIFLWGAQLVQGTTPGDYKATYAAAAAVGYTDIYGQPFAQKLVENTATSIHSLIQPITPTTSTLYTGTLYVKAAERAFAFVGIGQTGNNSFASINLSTGAVSVAFGSPTVSATSIGNGWFRVSVTVASISTANLSLEARISTDGVWDNRSYTGDGTSGIYIFGAQLSDSASVDPYVYQPVAAPTSTAYYGPRFDYDPVTLAPKGLLIEEQRTNLLLYSEQFDNVSGWAVGSNTSVSANTTVAPNGTTTADTITTTSVFNSIRTLDVTVSASTSYTFSIYVQRGTATDLKWSVYNLSGAADILAPTSYYSQTSAAGWTRCTLTFATPVGCTSIRVFPLRDSGASGTVFFWGAQLEAGSFATSYIPTVASQVTRAADSASMIGNNFARWYNQNTGTAFIDYATFASGSITLPVMEFSDGTTNNRMLFQNNPAGNSRVLAFVGGSAVVTTLDATAVAQTKVGAAYSVGSWAASYNGAAALTNSYAGVVPGQSQLIIGYTTAGGTPRLNGTIKRIAYYNRRLSNTELQGLTS